MNESVLNKDSPGHFEFKITPNLLKVLEKQGVIECVHVVNGYEEQFGIGCFPITKEGGNRRSSVIMAIGNKGTKAVLKTPNNIYLRSVGERKQSEKNILSLARESGIEEVPKVLGDGLFNYNPISYKFDTKDPDNERPYFLAEDVSREEEPKTFLYERLTVWSKLDYSIKEFNVMLRLFEKAGIAYVDFDDEVWLDLEGNPTVKFVDFSEEKSTGIPLSTESSMRLADFLYKLIYTNEITGTKVEKPQKTIEEDVNLIRLTSELMKRYGILDEKKNNRLIYLLNDNNIEKYLKLRKKQQRKYFNKLSSEETTYLKEYETSTDIGGLIEDREKNFHSSIEKFFERRIEPLLNDLGIKNVMEVKNNFLSKMELFNKVIDPKGAIEEVQKHFRFDKARGMIGETALLFLINIDGRILSAREIRFETAKQKLERKSKQSEILKLKTFIELIFSSIEKCLE